MCGAAHSTFNFERGEIDNSVVPVVPVASRLEERRFVENEGGSTSYEGNILILTLCVITTNNSDY